jgi:predicted small lipoprotein YifL
MRVVRAAVLCAALLAGVTACGTGGPANPYTPTEDDARVFAETWGAQPEKDKNEQCDAAQLVGHEALVKAARGKLDRPEAFATLLLATCGREER